MSQKLVAPIQDVLKSRERLPVVLRRAEVAKLLNAMDEEDLVIGQASYGMGLRLMECLRLRTKDIDFDRQVIIVREGKGCLGTPM